MKEENRKKVQREGVKSIKVGKKKKEGKKPDIPYCGRARVISGFRHPHQKSLKRVTD